MGMRKVQRFRARLFLINLVIILFLSFFVEVYPHFINPNSLKTCLSLMARDTMVFTMGSWLFYLYARTTEVRGESDGSHLVPSAHNWGGGDDSSPPAHNAQEADGGC